MADISLVASSIKLASLGSLKVGRRSAKESPLLFLISAASMATSSLLWVKAHWDKSNYVYLVTTKVKVHDIR